MVGARIAKIVGMKTEGERQLKWQRENSKDLRKIFSLFYPCHTESLSYSGVNAALIGYVAVCFHRQKLSGVCCVLPLHLSPNCAKQKKASVLVIADRLRLHTGASLISKNLTDDMMSAARELTQGVSWSCLVFVLCGGWKS